jgi:hypothetical protein
MEHIADAHLMQMILHRCVVQVVVVKGKYIEAKMRQVEADVKLWESI